jgi:hypothetical protein
MKASSASSSRHGRRRNTRARRRCVHAASRDEPGPGVLDAPSPRARAALESPNPTPPRGRARSAAPRRRGGCTRPRSCLKVSTFSCDIANRVSRGAVVAARPPVARSGTAEVVRREKDSVGSLPLCATKRDASKPPGCESSDIIRPNLPPVASVPRVNDLSHSQSGRPSPPALHFQVSGVIPCLRRPH